MALVYGFPHCCVLVLHCCLVVAAVKVDLDASIHIDLTATFLLVYLSDRMFSLFDDTQNSV